MYCYHHIRTCHVTLFCYLSRKRGEGSESSTKEHRTAVAWKVIRRSCALHTTIRFMRAPPSRESRDRCIRFVGGCIDNYHVGAEGIFFLYSRETQRDDPSCAVPVGGGRWTHTHTLTHTRTRLSRSVDEILFDAPA